VFSVGKGDRWGTGNIHEDKRRAWPGEILKRSLVQTLRLSLPTAIGDAVASGIVASVRLHRLREFMQSGLCPTVLA
jgi:hypothetical protein